MPRPWPSPKLRPVPTTPYSSTEAQAWARPTSCTPSATTPRRSTRESASSTSIQRSSSPTSSPACATAIRTTVAWRGSSDATARSIFSWLMTSSSSRARSPPLRSSSTLSTPCTPRASRSFSPPTSPPRHWADSTSVCARASSGACWPTSSPRIWRPASRSSPARALPRVSICPSTSWSTSPRASPPTSESWRAHSSA